VSRVRITVEDPILGEVDVSEDDNVYAMSASSQRKAIDRLLATANRKIRLAYELDVEAVS